MINPHIIRLFCFLALAVAVASADVVVYQQGATNAFVTGYAGTSDTHLNLSEPDLNYGATLSTTYSSTDTTRGLLRFDLSSFAGNYARKRRNSRCGKRARSPSPRRARNGVPAE